MPVTAAMVRAIGAGGVVPLAVAAGVVLCATGLVILAGASDDLDERMPWLVLPRRFAVYPLAAGAVLLVLVGLQQLLP